MFANIRRYAAGAAVVALASFGAMAGASAASASVHPANTGSCGVTCIEPYFLSSGPQWVQVDHDGSGKVNTEINLQYRTSTNSHEDWLASGQGPVDGTYCPGVDPSTPAIDPLFTANQCEALNNYGYGDDTAFQLEFKPLGVNPGSTAMCSGVWNDQAPVAGDRIRLEPCGVNGDTVWIAASDLSVLGTTPYINGGSNNFSDPLVITEATGRPAYQSLHLQELNIDSADVPSSNQLVGLLPGL
jgi:hypothetical protein